MKSNVKPLNWAILGMGEIAGQMASQMKAEGRSIYAAGGRNPQKAEAFAAKYGIGKAYGSLDELFEDK